MRIHSFDFLWIHLTWKFNWLLWIHLTIVNSLDFCELNWLENSLDFGKFIHNFPKIPASHQKNKNTRKEGKTAANRLENSNVPKRMQFFSALVHQHKCRLGKSKWEMRELSSFNFFQVFLAFLKQSSNPWFPATNLQKATNLQFFYFLFFQQFFFFCICVCVCWNFFFDKNKLKKSREKKIICNKWNE